MALDFSSLQGESAQSGYLDFSSLGAVPAVGGGVEEDSTSMLGAAGRGAVGMLPLGEQAYAGIESLVDKTPYLEERKELERDIEADKLNHPGSRLAGQAAGVIAPALLTGGTSTAGVVAQGAAMGAGFGAGEAIDTLASGGTGAEAAADVALGTVGGAAGGAAGKGLGNVISKIAKPFVNSQDEILAEATAGILGGTTRQIRSLPGKNPVETLAKLGRDMTRYKVNGEPLVGVTDQMPDRLNKFLALQKQSGETIGNTIRTAKVPPMSARPIAEELNAALKFATPDDQAQMKAVLDQVAQYADPGTGTIPFDRLHILKGELGDRAFEGQGNPVLQSAYHVISDVQDRELEKIASTINKPAFDDAKAAYSLTSRAIPLLRMAVSKEIGGKTNLVIPGAALLAGHPLVAAGALMKNRLGQMGSGAVFKGVQALPAGAGAAAEAIPGRVGAQIGGTVQQNMGETKPLPGSGAPSQSKTQPNKLNIDHPAMAQWKGMFMKNAEGAKNPGEIEKSQAVTDFILSQRDPGYAEAKKKVADNPMPEAPAAPAAPAAPEPIGMAHGGVVEEKSDLGTLKGLENVMRKAYGKEKPKPTLPTKSDVKMNQPFNTDFADKLRAFLEEKHNAESR